MNKFLGFGIGLFLVASPRCLAQKVIEHVNQLELKGQFKESAAELTTALKNTGLPEAERKELEFELDRLERIKKDFPYTQDALFAELKGSVKDLSRDEFERWVSEGRFDSREIDGQRYFMGSSGSNLFFRYPELNPRRTPPKETAVFEKFIWETCSAIKKAAMAEQKPYVLPKRLHVAMTVTAKPTAAPSGELIRAWLPIPRTYPFQGDFELISTSSKVLHLDEALSPIRALTLEQKARMKEPTEFEVEYNYTIHGVSFAIDPADVRPCDSNDAALKPFLAEASHVVFTPELRELSRKIAGDEQNPYLKAKKFYDWIGDRIKYSYAIEYSTIRNISD